MLIKLDKYSTIAEGLDALGGRVVGCYVDGEPFNTHNGGVVGEVLDLSGHVAQVRIGDAHLSLYTGWSIIIETENVPETLLERKERLEKELSETEAEIAREELPSGFSWGEDHDGVTVKYNEDVHGYASRAIAWEDSDRKLVYLNVDKEYDTLPAAAIFAWVDRARELGETDL